MIQRKINANSKPIMEALDSMEESGLVKILREQPPEGGGRGKLRMQVILVRDPDQDEARAEAC
jgi:hypothetical protein